MPGFNQERAEGADRDDPRQHCDHREEDRAVEGETAPARKGGGVGGLLQ